MRRQVKPFVTEYRGTPRRNKDLSALGEHQQDSQAPKGRTFAEAEKIFHSPDPTEDSYEAALRAADALFAMPARTSEMAADPMLARQPEMRSAPKVSSPPMLPDFSAPRAFAAAEATRGGEAGELDASPRRILQAIEQAPEDRFAALEAERAPKRRGRKPGSKNKPKIAVDDDWAFAVSRPALAGVAVLPGVVSLIPALAAARLPLFAETHEVDKPHELVDAAGDDQAMPQPRGRNEKFGWKRAELRPGERWKRRLPKAAW